MPLLPPRSARTLPASASATVVQRDPSSGPPDPGWIPDWESRLRTLLAEAAAQGMPAEAITAHCDAALAGFAFPPAQDQP